MKRWMLVLLAVALAGSVMRQTAGQEPSSASTRGIVPVSATLEPLARAVPGGNAVLRVRFEDGTRLPPRIPYATEGGMVVLADDGKGFDRRAGDGLYTALGSMDLQAARERLVRLANSRTAMPTRTWRHRAKQHVDARLDPGAFQAGQQVPWETWGDPEAVSRSRSLMITSLGVVEDPTRTSATCGQPSMGSWSFGYLMEQMANTPVTGVSGPEFTRAWLDRWMSTQIVNGWDVDPRTPMQEEIIDPWVAASGGPGMPLDLSKAPFKLLAIVNRIDLRHQSAYGGGSGGELRFVFMHLRDGCVTPTGQPFEVILEFGVPASGCVNVKAWAKQWKALAALPLGSPAYNAALEAITQQVVVANAASSRPNGSALNQIRTNESRLDDLGGFDWQVREFRIDSGSHLLVQHTLAQTPQRSLASGPVPAQYVNGHSWSILNGIYVVPLAYPAGMPFRGGSITYSVFGSTWDGPAATPMIDREARHLFSLNTCTGCHYGETETFSFQHVRVAPFGTQASLSDFLTGGFVDDAEDGMPTRYFNDLERRATDMDALLNTSCFEIPLDLPLLSASH